MIEKTVSFDMIFLKSSIGELLTSLKMYPFMYKGIEENRSYNDMIEAGF